MNPAEASIRFGTVTAVFTVLMVVLGIAAYFQISRLEDPEFTIKEALIITPYPGASAHEVAEEVSNVIELAVQQMGQLDRVESRSERGRSTVTVVIKPQYTTAELPAVWTELRNRVGDARRFLPPGAGPSLVLDDFGDVYGIFFALTGADYSYAELYDTAKMLRRELLLVPDVMKVDFFGRQQEAVYIEFSRDQLAQLGIRAEQIFAALREQNLVASAGRVDAGPLAITVDPTGEWSSVEDFENLLIAGGGADARKLIFLKDIATVRRGFVEPPTAQLRYDGEAAIGLGISTLSGGNVVRMGEAVERRIDELRGRIPLGIELHKVSFQADAVTAAINDFMINLGMSVVIVFATLLVAMGLRSGAIIGIVLLVTIAGTLFIMKGYGLSLERVSLGALIIALVMLVDNAIVVTEGMLVAVEKGMDKVKAAAQVVKQAAIPLLGATGISVLAFGAIGLSDDSTGEYTRSLFDVLLFSLGLSWITAITVTPWLCYLFFKTPEKPAESGDKKGDAKEPYDSTIYRGYRSLLLACMKAKTLTFAVLVGLLALSVFGARFLENSFFPDSTRDQFTVDVWAPVGTRLEETDRIASEMLAKLREMPGVTHVTTVVGQGALRFLLQYAPERFDTAYAQFIVDVEDPDKIGELLTKTRLDLSDAFPETLIIAKRFRMGPGTGGSIQGRFLGDDYGKVRAAAVQAMQILREDGGTMGVRIDSREQVAILRPQFSEAQARLTGITRTELAATIESAFSGRPIGVYREGDELLPIIARGPEAERNDPDLIRDVQVFSPVAGRTIPVRQIVAEFPVELEDPIVHRRDRKPVITVHADPNTGLPSKVFDRVRSKIEAIDVPGVTFEWGGEYENSAQAQAALAASLPLFIMMMVLIVILLFNSLKITLIIWLTIPLSIIGIVVGLLVFNQPFGFLALLGALALSGMLIKNGVVLIDEIRLLQGQGKDPFTAIVEGSLSRVRPVSMSALTSVFGLIPLIFDAFFASMAVTIVVGLLFATILTLVVVPVLYAAFFKVRPAEPPLAQPAT